MTFKQLWFVIVVAFFALALKREMGVDLSEMDRSESGLRG